MAECATCGRPCDDATVCAPCARRIADALRELAGLAPELDVTIARQGRSGGGGRGADRHPLPVDLGASEHAWAVVNTVVTWIRDTARSRGITAVRYPRTVGPTCRTNAGVPGCAHASCRTIARSGQPVDELAEAIRWLAGQVEWLRHQPDAVQAMDELEDACALATRIVDSSDPLVIVGACPCGQRVYGRKGRDYATCRGCGERYDIERSKQELRRHLDAQLMTAAEIATLAMYLELTDSRHRTRKLINVWSGRGVIATRGQTNDGPTYRFGEVIERLTRSVNDHGGATVTSQRAG